MISSLYSIYHPGIFQGRGRSRSYFEGWYYKLVSADGREAMAFIPGIALSDETERHAFVQVIDGVRQTTAYHTYPFEEFSADRRQLDIRIGPNHFTDTGLSLDLPDWQGAIEFAGMTPIRASWLSPGIMGWYSFVPGMQCYHGIVSMYHRLSGMLTGPQGQVELTGGAGYLEKDWGSSFPKCWIWVHSNSFTGESPASLMASVAHIPWMGRYFPGFITVLWVHGKEYRFATYNGSRIRCEVLEDRVVLAFRRRGTELRMTAHRGPTAQLRSPITGMMTGKVNESLQATVEAELFLDGQSAWASSGTPAGLEVAGDTRILESSVWRA